MASSFAWGRSRARTALVCSLLALGGTAQAVAGANPPELGWRLQPGAGNGSEESQTATTGPIGVSAVNGPPGVTSSGAVEADYGTLAAETSTAVDASGQTGESFCFPIAPAPHCSAAEGWWADRLIFSAPGVVVAGTPGSFTARVSISAAVAATKPFTQEWSFVVVESDYSARVEVSGFGSEQISVSCIAIGFAGFDCIPVTLQILFPTGTDKMPAGPSGTFELGPYDFVWGQPFDFEVRLTANTSMNTEDRTSGQASATADLGNTLVWDGVVQLFDAPGGAGSSVPLGQALVSPASGVDWLKTVAVPEPRGPGPNLTALCIAAGLAAATRARSARRGVRVRKEPPVD